MPRPTIGTIIPAIAGALRAGLSLEDCMTTSAPGQTSVLAGLSRDLAATAEAVGR
jgi:hypothetical protein